ncbi:hypothetical protein PGT21_015717 [Puccinia graminis f. sp. tritici]|uniref:Uncharacterized protein n=1 Tax=Puccinia graminis f. sp. tritici TaxID=56615 RepID=A0A5B0M8P7_PUCGR|nr:hypothetical protein PGT21_015717 [Puccinia graminis f. sp. tritici]
MARRYHPPQSAIHQTDKLASSKTTKASKDNYVSISCSCPMIPVPVSPNPPELARTACFGIETLFLTASAAHKSVGRTASLIIACGSMKRSTGKNLLGCLYRVCETSVPLPEFPATGYDPLVALAPDL